MNRMVFVVAMVGASVSPAYSQPAGAQAEVLFNQGRSLLSAGKLPEACAAFEESQKLEPAVTTLINLAGCREKQGKLATAWGLFLDVERQTRTSNDATSQHLRTVAVSHAQQLEPHVSKLTIVVAPKNQVSGLVIRRGNDRVDVPLWNTPLPIDGGTYTITAEAPGSVRWSTELTVSESGDAKSVEVPALTKLPGETAPQTASPAPPAPALAPPPRPEPKLSSHGSSKTLAFTFTAGSAVLLGAAVGFNFWGESYFNQAIDETTSQDRRDSLLSSANMRRHLAQGFAIGGLACAGVAAWLFLRHGEAQPSDSVASHVMISPTGIGYAGGF